MPTGMYLTLIQPFLEYLTQKREGEKIFFQSLMKRVILDGLDRIVEAAAERVKRMNKQGGEDEDEEEDEDKEEEDEEKAIPFVHVNGPKILKVLLEIGGDEYVALLSSWCVCRRSEGIALLPGTLCHQGEGLFTRRFVSSLTVSHS